MDTMDCRPGYTLLRLQQKGRIWYSREILNAMTEFKRSTYLSSVAFLSNYLDIVGGRQHGPCSTSLCKNSLGKHETDKAISFRCQSWPDDLSDFRYRTIQGGWPSRQVVNSIVQNGCHFVAIGDKHSSLSALQWRISFTKAETALVVSFNHVQLKTYALLKIFLKECIDRDPFIQDLLCSYFMKTIVFHAIEHSRPSMWVEGNLIQCFWHCFTILMECIQTGYLPNYFILSHNMFLSNVTGDNRERLLHVMTGYQCMGWTCLLQCPSLQCLTEAVNESNSVYHLCNHRVSVMNEIWQDSTILPTLDMITSDTLTMKIVHNVFLKCSDDILCDTALLYFTKSMTNFSMQAIVDLTNRDDNTNKVVYNQIRRHKRLLHASSATFACEGHISLATFYYNVGCYNKASEVAMDVVIACQQTALAQKHGMIEEHIPERYGRGYTLLQRAKRFHVLDYVIDREYNRLYPSELYLEVQTTEDRISLPPLPYAIFLLVLCTYRLGNNDQSRIILDDLLAVRSNLIYGVCNYPILHNVIGICYQLLGDVRHAIQAFEESIKRLADNSAAHIRINYLRSNCMHKQNKTASSSLDYCNIPCRYPCIDEEDEDNDEVLFYHKAMYNFDPASFVDMSWFKTVDEVF
ncbi:uncharacterized protein LOC132565371 [Ylistrum balloti]|uniref:uncharacterized protein LOC132565371 n=1 Tax=Ylistrum balloti TaxID=509963 RepID=UPI002905F4A3|nr:uncharacterized protein LOC132565371 [Ylistrum balloti]